MKKMFYIGAALLAGAFGLTAFEGEKPEDMIAARLQTKIDEFNATKQAECDANVLAAATVKADSIVAAMAAVPAKGGKTIATAPKGGKKPATKTTKGGTSATTPVVVPTPPTTKPDPKGDKVKASQGQVTPEATQKKADKVKQAGGEVTPAATQKKADKMKAANGGGGGGK